LAKVTFFLSWPKSAYYQGMAENCSAKWSYFSAASYRRPRTRKILWLVTTLTLAAVALTACQPFTLISVFGDERKVLSTDQLRGPCSIHIAANGAALPDPACTPGAISSRVTQANINQTICASGYTSSVRPSTSVTNPLKVRTAQIYGLSYNPKVQEYDHLIPLELGGANDVRNLWVEPADSTRQTTTTNKKDSIENKLKSDVCAGRITLVDAQTRIAMDWTTALMSNPTPATTIAPPPPTPTTAPPSLYFSNCTEARQSGHAPLYRGQAGYRSQLDRDGDGVACE
jgi:hypothetical protein